MADFTKDTNWIGSKTLTSQSATLTLPVGGKYVDRDINFTVTAQSGSAKVKPQAYSALNTQLSGTNISLEAFVAPVVSEGWVSSADGASISITGTVPTQDKTATPSSEVQMIEPNSGYLLSSVQVDAVVEEPAEYGDVIDGAEEAGFDIYPTLIQTSGYVSTSYLSGIRLESGKQFDINTSNASFGTLKYDSDLSALVFEF